MDGFILVVCSVAPEERAPAPTAVAELAPARPVGLDLACSGIPAKLALLLRYDSTELIAWANSEALPDYGELLAAGTGPSGWVAREALLRTAKRAERSRRPIRVAVPAAALLDPAA